MDLRTLLALTACNACVTWAMFRTLLMRSLTSRVFGIDLYHDPYIFLSIHEERRTYFIRINAAFC
jgi:hypothetical protein